MLSNAGNYQWELELIYSNADYALNANQMVNGDIVVVAAVHISSSYMQTITLDAEGNIIDIAKKNATAYTSYDGIVERDGTVGLLNYHYALIRKECVAGTYQSSSNSLCLQCPVMTYQDKKEQSFCIDCLEGTYQDETGQTSCKPCVSPCKSCTTATNCLDCVGGFFLEIADSKDNKCVTACQAGLYGNSDTGKCEGTLI